MKPTMVLSMTAGRLSTAPSLRRLRGMRTRPTSGRATNQIPPPIRNAAASRMPATELTWMATKVAMTGPSTQMISWADASRENNGVSWRELTIFG
jgi:hypothetical protein